MFPSDCQICFLDYDTEERKIMSGSCGHSLCLDCSSNLAANTCPFCQLPGSFSKAVPNYLAMDMLAARSTGTNTAASSNTLTDANTASTSQLPQETTDEMLAQMFTMRELIFMQHDTIQRLTKGLTDLDDQLGDRNVLIQTLSSQLDEKHNYHENLKAMEKPKKKGWFSLKKAAVEQ